LTLQFGIFFFFFLQWCFVLPNRGGTAKHLETRARLQWLLFRNWKELQGGAFSSGTRACCSFIFGPRSFDAHVSLGFFLCFTPQQWLGQSLALGHVEEYAHVVKALAPLPQLLLLKKPFL
jgi:hypothetical protein